MFVRLQNCKSVRSRWLDMKQNTSQRFKLLYVSCTWREKIGGTLMKRSRISMNWAYKIYAWGGSIWVGKFHQTVKIFQVNSLTRWRFWKNNHGISPSNMFIDMFDYCNPRTNGKWKRHLETWWCWVYQNGIYGHFCLAWRDFEKVRQDVLARRSKPL